MAQRSKLSAIIFNTLLGYHEESTHRTLLISLTFYFFSNPNEQDILTTGNQFASLTNQLTISVNMIVAVFAMFGVGYYVGMQYSDNKSTVSPAITDKK
jgi:hypothetical protein